jgi:hypothetical protein
VSKRGRVPRRTLSQIVSALKKDASPANKRKLAEHFKVSLRLVDGISRGSYPTIHRGKIHSDRS